MRSLPVSEPALGVTSASVCPSVSIGGFYPDFGSPDGSPIRDPSPRLPLDPHADRGFGAWPSRPDGAPLGLAPLPRRPYQEEEEEQEAEEEVSWRPAPPFPPFPDRSRGGAPRRLYESEAPPLRGPAPAAPS